MSTLIKIASMHSSFSTKFGIPKQSNIVKTIKSTIVFENEYRNPHSLRGLEHFSHIWIIWGFSEVKEGAWSPTVRPPRLGGNIRMGVFATRSPFRPNAIGLSSVKIDCVEYHPNFGPVIHVLGADLLDGTPIYDIKPYIPYADCHPEAKGGLYQEAQQTLQVQADEKWLALIPDYEQENLKQLLALDPRPAYQRDPQRVYGMNYGGFEIKFTVDKNLLTIVEIKKQ